MAFLASTHDSTNANGRLLFAFELRGHLIKQYYTATEKWRREGIAKRQCIFCEMVPRVQKENKRTPSMYLSRMLSKTHHATRFKTALMTPNSAEMSAKDHAYSQSKQLSTACKYIFARLLSYSIWHCRLYCSKTLPIKELMHSLLL